MRNKRTHKPSMPTIGLLAAAAAVLAGCGDHVGTRLAGATPAKLAITATEAGKQLRLSVPRSVPAGLVTVELTNKGKAFHEAQLIRLEPGHTPEEALKVIAAEGAPSPGWLHVAGGTGPAPPGGKRSATQRLRPGKYIAYDAPFQNEGKGLKFGLASFKVEGPANDGGELPKAVAKIEAYERGHQRRSTVLTRIAALRAREPWPGYDELTAGDIRAALDDADEQLAQRVYEYERAHKNRSSVLEVAARERTHA